MQLLSGHSVESPDPIAGAITAEIQNMPFDESVLLEKLEIVAELSGIVLIYFAFEIRGSDDAKLADFEEQSPLFNSKLQPQSGIALTFFLLGARGRSRGSSCECCRVRVRSRSIYSLSRSSRALGLKTSLGAVMY